MKCLLLSLALCVFAAFGQRTTPATPQAPTAKTVAAAAAVGPDAVVLKVGDKPMTAAQFETLVAAFTPEIQKAARANPKQVIQSYYLMQSLMRQAEQEKLDQTSPLKEQLEVQRMQLLAQTVVNRQAQGIAITQEDQRKRYEADKDTKYMQAKVRGILIHFGDPAAINAQVDMSDPKEPKASIPRNLRTEAEAKAIAEDLATQLRSGADFAALAKLKSDDKGTAVKGGDFGMVHQMDNMPAELKKAAFALKPGEVTDPIRQPVGFYVLKVDERGTQAFSEVQRYVANDVKNERFQKWMAEVQKPFEVTVENPAFFGAPALPMPSAK